MDELLVFGVYLLLCVGVGYAAFFALREFVSGLKAANADVNALQRASYSSNYSQNLKRRRKMQTQHSMKKKCALCDHGTRSWG
jgi:hypothetical protein